MRELLPFIAMAENTANSLHRFGPGVLLPQYQMKLCYSSQKATARSFMFGEEQRISSCETTAKTGSVLSICLTQER